MKKQKPKAKQRQRRGAGGAADAPDAGGARLGPIPASAVGSALKYVYLAAFFMLLSGFFHPLITNTSFESVITGTLVLAAGLLGGIFLYWGASAGRSEAARIILFAVGFALIGASLYAITLMTGRI